MSDRPIEESALALVREQERIEELKTALRICTTRLSLPLYMVFWFADLIYAPHYKWEFLVLRSLMIPINLLIYSQTATRSTVTHLENTSLLFAFANANLITIMIYLTEGAGSPYYAGLNLVAVGILAIFPWTRAKLPWAVAAIFGPYYLVGIGSLLLGGEVAGLALNSFFIAGIILASVVKHQFTEQLRVTEIISRLRLHHEVKSREEIIERKTQEALKLATLTKQFSPQVVQAIRSGNLVLSGSKQGEICAIFVDIVNSTKKVVGLDINETSTVISMFMEDTMKVLLKYDITIDKFMGDGVLAFCNAPVKHPDYIVRVVQAALEIQMRLQSRAVVYSDHWRDEFKICVGIAAGEAKVGFFGSDYYFKSYTAIGAVVNLACRLCGEALPGQVLVCERVARAVSSTTPAVKLQYRPSLKGFESESIAVYEIPGVLQGSNDLPEVYFCPNEHGVLHLDTSDSGIYVFKCRECGYVLDQSTIPPQTHLCRTPACNGAVA